jgi:hypothetical protein
MRLADLPSLISMQIKDIAFLAYSVPVIGASHADHAPRPSDETLIEYG